MGEHLQGDEEPRAGSRPPGKTNPSLHRDPENFRTLRTTLDFSKSWLVWNALTASISYLILHDPAYNRTWQSVDFRRILLLSHSRFFVDRAKSGSLKEIRPPASKNAGNREAAITTKKDHLYEIEDGILSITLSITNRSPSMTRSELDEIRQDF